MILPGETEAGSAGTQPCRGISRRAHRDDERGVRARSCAPNLHRIERPRALKIPARRAEYSLTENVASPFQAEPRQKHTSFLHCTAHFSLDSAQAKERTLRHFTRPCEYLHFRRSTTGPLVIKLSMGS